MLQKVMWRIGAYSMLASTCLAGQMAWAAGTEPGQVAALEAQVAQLQKTAQANADRAAVENLFSRYKYLHNAFQDNQIVDLWAKKGTPDIRAQYSNLGVYTNWDSIISYHRDRPSPIGKLLFHYVTTPIIEVAGDGQTAKGLWIVNGLESGLTDPEHAKNMPDWMFEKDMVDGKKVWMHNVYLKYGIDFIKQDGQWKIWHFHCFEVARAPYGMGWIPLPQQPRTTRSISISCTWVMMASRYSCPSLTARPRFSTIPTAPTPRRNWKRGLRNPIARLAKPSRTKSSRGA